eukprot:763224-Hanusia_phi.AAC.1
MVTRSWGQEVKGQRQERLHEGKSEEEAGRVLQGKGKRGRRRVAHLSLGEHRQRFSTSLGDGHEVRSGGEKRPEFHCPTGIVSRTASRFCDGREGEASADCGPGFSLVRQPQSLRRTKLNWSTS